MQTLRPAKLSQKGYSFFCCLLYLGLHLDTQPPDQSPLADESESAASRAPFAQQSVLKGGKQNLASPSDCYGAHRKGWVPWHQVF